MTIRNGDLPAMPVEHMDFMRVKERPYCNGLTKREMFAMAALQGVLAKPNVAMNYAAMEAVMLADKLLTELERTK